VPLDDDSENSHGNLPVKNPIEKINKSFESRVRLGVMSALMVNDEVDFLTMKDLLDVTDGNLASHINALEAEGYLSVRKEFVGKKTKTSYQATRAGKEAFLQHLKALEELIRAQK
jgi:DNA-binding HxlR family transcriptional regulator